MDQPISAAEANRRFSRLLREVRQGQSYVVTAHGEPIARIIPLTAAAASREAARIALFRRLEAQPVRDIGRWSREELYDAP
jgi:prevent-host-death family protein